MNYEAYELPPPPPKVAAVPVGGESEEIKDAYVAKIVEDNGNPFTPN